MRAWLYYRLSRDEDQEMNSLHNQRQILVDYAQQHGYEIVGESFDDNVTGIDMRISANQLQKKAYGIKHSSCYHREP